MTTASDILNVIKEKGAEFVDFRFTDTKGRWHHMTQHVSTVDDDMLTDGIMFDGSSISGWKTIDDSDMLLLPDFTTAVMDPFSSVPQLVIICNVAEPSTGEGYDRDPRTIAKRALAYMADQNVGDAAYFGPEAEFFMFDDVRWSTDPYKTGFALDDEELPTSTDTEYPYSGNDGYHIKTKGGYIPTLPLDKCGDIRADMVTTGLEFDIPMEKHHHEVASSQHELGTRFQTLVECGDMMQKYKYTVQNVAKRHGKTATFMPKPVKGDNGTGMHIHQSIWKDGDNTFAGDGYAGLSKTCLYYIGGIIKHAKAINAFTNASTNSYKRLIPGFEAPVLLAYSASNRSASCRIPHVSSPKAKRIEVRFPDPSANPYLAYTALLMAGLDGIKNKIHPGDPKDQDLYALSPEELQGIPTVAGSLREALESLDADRAFLTVGGVLTDEFIDSYLDLKWEEVYTLEHTPHPVEFDMYYDC